MRRVPIAIFLLSSPLASTDVLALSMDLYLNLTTTNSKSIVDVYSPPSEADDYEFAQLRARIYEEGVLNGISPLIRPCGVNRASL